ncbi:C4-dicarboxylate transporter DctA [Legionella quateirensis]|uniref:C4-dicarboxylate transport protein n=1 Tax=Legionella quateirensis TaxID=45072 RepID=A0A378KR79_9GAMM|nr:C4-dicarboxylate transporter DctA [Legionella quateirensis]KTD42470.1 C4-dicarboxylate transport protein [Legionella quateirensis]STY17075.1 aerobic C4-dicarboxylate transport protein [Legionella quateirensis]
MNFLKKLYVQVLLGVLLGVLFGYMLPDFAVQFKVLSDVFIKIIKMLISPIIFLTLVSGIAAMNDMRQVGRLAGGALLFFMIITTIALMLGLGAADYFKPGVGLNIDPTSLNLDEANSYLGTAHKATNMTDLLMNIIPRTFISAFVDGEMLQVLFISILFAIGLILTGSIGKQVVNGMEVIAKVFFKIIHVVMYMAPVATFAAMAFSVGRFGIAPLFNLFGLLACYYLTSILFILMVLGTILQWYCKINIWHLLRYLKDELVIVWATASSETVLPSLMQKLENLGCEKSVVGLVLPLGYSFNLAGTAIYLTLAAMFIAQATNTELTVWQELALLGVMIISSKGAAGVSGSGFIVLASSLATIGHIPAAGVVLVLGIDKFMNEGRSIINMTGNAIATIIISTWQHSFDYKQAQSILKEQDKPDTQAIYLSE